MPKVTTATPNPSQVNQVKHTKCQDIFWLMLKVVIATANTSEVHQDYQVDLMYEILVMSWLMPKVKSSFPNQS